MTKEEKSKPYDLEERTEELARRVRALLKELPKTMSNIEDGKQAIRASGSVGANYIEANEAPSKKDFRYRIKISRKEAKETRYWLRLLDVSKHGAAYAERSALCQEATELVRIFSAILRNSE